MKVAADDGLHAEQRKIGGFDADAVEAGWIGFGEVAGLGAGIHGRDGFEGGNFSAPIEIVEAELKFASLDGRGDSVGDDAAGVGIRGGAEKHAIHDGENGGGCADAEREDE